MFQRRSRLVAAAAVMLLAAAVLLPRASAIRREEGARAVELNLLGGSSPGQPAASPASAQAPADEADKIDPADAKAVAEMERKSVRSQSSSPKPKPQASPKNSTSKASTTKSRRHGGKNRGKGKEGAVSGRRNRGSTIHPGKNKSDKKHSTKPRDGKLTGKHAAKTSNSSTRSTTSGQGKKAASGGKHTKLTKNGNSKRLRSKKRSRKGRKGGSTEKSGKSKGKSERKVRRTSKTKGPRKNAKDAKTKRKRSARKRSKAKSKAKTQKKKNAKGTKTKRKRSARKRSKAKSKAKSQKKKGAKKAKKRKNPTPKCALKTRSQISAIASKELGVCFKNQTQWERLREYWAATGGDFTENPAAWNIAFINFVLAQWPAYGGLPKFTVQPMTELPASRPGTFFLEKQGVSPKPPKANEICTDKYCIRGFRFIKDTDQGARRIAIFDHKDAEFSRVERGDLLCSSESCSVVTRFHRSSRTSQVVVTDFDSKFGEVVCGAASANSKFKCVTARSNRESASIVLPKSPIDRPYPNCVRGGSVTNRAAQFLVRFKEC